jgi:hypothetical protein
VSGMAATIVVMALLMIDTPMWLKAADVLHCRNFLGLWNKIKFNIWWNLLPIRNTWKWWAKQNVCSVRQINRMVVLNMNGTLAQLWLNFGSE